MHQLKDTALAYLHNQSPMTFERIHSAAVRDLPEHTNSEEDKRALAGAITALLAEGEIRMEIDGQAPTFSATDSRHGASLPALLALFPTLAGYAARAEKEAWSPRELVNQINSRNESHGATHAAHFIACALDSTLAPFPIAQALTRWDRAHRLAWKRATARLATSI
jgi:hypothetical protein